MKGESLLGWTPMEAVAVKGGEEPRARSYIVNRTAGNRQHRRAEP